MKPIAAGIALPPLAGLLVVLWGLPAHGQATDLASVGVSIRILPTASIEFPDGFDFIITVPENKNGKGHDKDKGKGHDSHGNGNGYGHDKDGPVIKPVLIPFKVRGNALASISARPDDFMRIQQGPYLGAAVGPGGDSHKNQRGKGHDKGKGKGHDKGGDGELGYNVIVQFPIQDWRYASLNGWDGFGEFLDDFASLPGQDGVGTPPLTTDVSQRGHAYGMIYIVARKDWTSDGKDAAPGDYRGGVEVTLTAEEQ